MIDRSSRPYSDLQWRYLAPPLILLAAAVPLVGSVAGFDAVLARYASWSLVSMAVLIGLAPVAGLAMAAHRWQGATAIALIALLFILNVMIISLPQVGPFAGLDWNWQGKTLDLLWLLAVIALLPATLRAECGWTWRTNPGTLPKAFVNLLILVFVGYFALGAVAVGEPLTLERVLFDTTHPNLVEEIIYRGFMLALLDRAFPPKWTFSGAHVGWGLVITAWLFGLVHGFTVDDAGALVFEPVWLVLTLVAGLMFGWLRALTGSLWPAFLAHCAPEIGILLALGLR